jgi:hypothetical protein
LISIPSDCSTFRQSGDTNQLVMSPGLQELGGIQAV